MPLMISLSYIRQFIFGLSETFASGDIPYLDIRSGLIEGERESAKCLHKC